MSEEQAALRDITEWWDRLPGPLRQDIEGSGNVPGCIARARRLLAAPAAPASGAEQMRWAEYVCWLGGLYVGCISVWKDNPHGKLPYRGWAMVKEEDGSEVGWFGTEPEAKAAVENAVRAAIAPEHERFRDVEHMVAPSPSPPGWEAVREQAAKIADDYRHSVRPGESIHPLSASEIAKRIRALPAPTKPSALDKS